MHIHLETPEQHVVQAYDDKKIQINSIIYESTVIVSKVEIITNLAIHKMEDIAQQYIPLLLQLKPEILLIGHHEIGKFLSIDALRELSIGIECMSMGAACRTHNILLGEHRAVVSVFIM